VSIFAVDVGGRPIAVFNAFSRREAERLIHGKGGLAEEWTALESDGRPVWDGKEKLTLREATPFEYNRWQASRSKETNFEDEEGLLHLLYLLAVHDPTNDMQDNC
jgi:hypothetical protein